MTEERSSYAYDAIGPRAFEVFSAGMAYLVKEIDFKSVFESIQSSSFLQRIGWLNDTERTLFAQRCFNLNQ